jgi:O-antigen ligase
MELYKNYSVKLLILTYLAGSMGLFAVLFVPQFTFNSSGSDSKVFMLVWVFFYLISLSIFFLYKIKIYKNELIIFIIPVFYLMSSLWSLDPTKTFIYSSILLLNCLFVILMKRVITPYELPKLLLYVIFAMCLSGMIANFLGYQNTNYLDIHNRSTLLGTQPIRGFFNHKITAGYHAVIGIILSFYLLSNYLRLAFIFIFCLFLLLTGSSAGLGLLFIFIPISILIGFSQKIRMSSKSFLIIILSVICASFFLFILIGGDVLAFLERDPTMTGRTTLWGWGIEVSFERFLTGWGYLGYNGTEVAIKAASTFKEFENYNVPHFHNSYVQYLVEAGWIFGIAFIYLYFKCILSWYSISLKTGSKEHISILIILMNMMIAGMFIHVLGRYNNFSMIIFFYILSYSFDFKSFKGKA